MRAIAPAIVLGWALLAVRSAQADGLRPFDASSWQAIRIGHLGRPTIVHFWGMTCGPCRVEMPKLGALLAKHPDVAVVTIDTDEVPGVAGAAERFLQASSMPLTDAWQFAGRFSEKLYFSVDPAWQGEIPMTILIDRKGAATETIGAVDASAIEGWLAAQGR